MHHYKALDVTSKEREAVLHASCRRTNADCLVMSEIGCETCINVAFVLLVDPMKSFKVIDVEIKTVLLRENGSALFGCFKMIGDRLHNKGSDED
ncbi:hypothetical protein [Candidatus Pristimantibacillus sp. PTI5]|uniref:hypothetical protein n=1 Tax=Candidatus Pristimantibacillus sp. PTI5 TaxID=3400422 RepID=UPI003B02D611